MAVEMLQYVGVEPIETERLVLRPFRVGDAPGMFRNWDADAAVARHMLWEPAQTLADSENRLAGYLKEYETDPATYRWAITLKGEDVPIGMISLLRVHPRHRTAEAVYMLGQAYQRQGYMPEALRGVLQYGFMRIGLNRIEAGHYTQNPASGRVMLKAGMRLEGIARQKYLGREGYEDTASYALLKEEFIAEKT